MRVRSAGSDMLLEDELGFEDPAEVAVRAVKAVLRTKSRKSPHRSPQAPRLACTIPPICLIPLCRKRPFATQRPGRRQTSPAVCRIPCRILCLANVARGLGTAGAVDAGRRYIVIYYYSIVLYYSR